MLATGSSFTSVCDRGVRPWCAREASSSCCCEKQKSLFKSDCKFDCSWTVKLDTLFARLCFDANAATSRTGIGSGVKPSAKRHGPTSYFVGECWKATLKWYASGSLSSVPNSYYSRYPLHHCSLTSVPGGQQASPIIVYNQLMLGVTDCGVSL